MSRKTAQILSLAERMKEAGIDPFWVDQVRSMQNGYVSPRTTCSLLYKDNMALRETLKLEPLVREQ